MRYWWVNNSQTARQEISGGFIWSPKREASGARSQFYENMRLVAPGDPIISYASGVVEHVGTVTDYAIHAPKPDEFGNVGSYWGRQGWLVPVQWRRLNGPVRPRDLIEVLGPLLPRSHSPIRPETGLGNQKAYLAEVGASVHQLILSQPLGSVGPAVAEALSLTDLRERLDRSADAEIQDDITLSATEKLQLMKARRGQGEFRKRVASIETSCRLTDISNERLLVASHIKPWRSCETAAERLDGHNGLLLAPHVDWLFDRGLLSFRDDGRAVVSKLLPDADVISLGLDAALRRRPRGFLPEQCRYLAHHRELVFLP